MISRKHTHVCHAATITTFDFGDHEDREDNRKKRKIPPEIQKRIDSLNTLFYDVHKLTGRELFELILDKFKKPYLINIENHYNQRFLVVHPEEVIHMKEYMSHLEHISQEINDCGLESIVKRNLKNIKLQRNAFTEKIMIPLDIYYTI
jgi:hypothetical protein